MSNYRKWEQYNMWIVMAAGGKIMPLPCFAEGNYTLGWACFSSTEKAGLKVKPRPETLSSCLSCIIIYDAVELSYVLCLFAFLFACRQEISDVLSLLEHQRLLSEIAPSKSWPTAHTHRTGFWCSLRSLRCCYVLLVSSGPVVSAAVDWCLPWGLTAGM